MKKFFNNRYFAAFAALSLVGLCSQAPVLAQVVNSAPGTSSANSQVTLTTSVPSIVSVKVDSGTSSLSSAFNPALVDSSANIASQDFKILGNVLVNSASANVQCTVSATTLKLFNGSDDIIVNLTGSIGGTAIATSGFTPTLTSKKAAINILGDLDESTVTSAKAPGTYSGTLTITASLL